MQSDFWIAQYVDENNSIKRISTKETDESRANRILVKLENEVSQIRIGIATRKDIGQNNASNKPLADHLEDFYTHQHSKGGGARQIKDDRTMLPRLFTEARISTLAGIERHTIEKWVIYSKDDKFDNKCRISDPAVRPYPGSPETCVCLLLGAR